MSVFSIITIAVYLLVLAYVNVIGITRWHYMDVPMRFFLALMLLTLLCEVFSNFYFMKHSTKAPIYHFYSMIELSLYGCYFLHTLYKRPSLLALVLLCLFSIAAGTINLSRFQPLHCYNTNILMMECIIVIAMSLYAMFSIARNDEIKDVMSYPHFQIWVSVLVLWTSTFFFFAFLLYLKKMENAYYNIIAPVQGLINIGIYIWVGYVFFRLKTKKVK